MTIGKNTTSRRTFIKKTALSTAGILSLPTIIPSGIKGANDKINVGLIGTGDHGITYNLPHFLDIDACRVVALCDVDSMHLEHAAMVTREKYGIRKIDTYRDFRELLLRDDIDAVQISTPDHWHVYQSVAALKAGKHVCCEKPTLTIKQGRILVDQVEKSGKIFQTSLEDRSLPPYHRMAELVRNRCIGKLVRMRVGLPGEYWYRFNTDLMTQPVPDYFDYDLWLGPAPDAPFSPGRCHWNFRWIEDYSGGNLTDWGAHMIDNAQWCNGTEKWGPVEVEGVGSKPAGGIYNAFNKFNLKYRYENGIELDVHSNDVEIYCEGTEGWLHVFDWNGKLQASSDEILNSVIGENEIHLGTAVNEHVNFIECIKNNQQPYHPAEDLHRTSTVCHMGNIAMRLERKLEWDPDKEEFVNDSEANSMLSRPERDPWKLSNLIES
jgi:predicted dehydrogenase